MQKLLMVAIATTMLATAAFAEERTITLTCSNDVEPGTLVLTNPPKVNCDDFETVKNVIGMGITVGPNADVTRMIQEARKVEQDIKTTKHPKVNSVQDNTGKIRLVAKPWMTNNLNKGVWQPLDDFDKRFPGSNRNREWFETDCTGWVNLNDVIKGKCGDARVRVN